MKLLERLKFAWKYDIEPEFIVCSDRGQHAISFLSYKDAKEFSKAQIQCKPKIMVAIKE